MKILIIIFSLSFLSQAKDILVPQPTLTLDGPAGRFDFMTVDQANDRLLAAHKGMKTLELLDLSTETPMKAVKIGEVQGLAVDAKGKRYFFGNEGGHNVVILDSKTLEWLGEVSVEGPVDAIAYDSKNGLVYAAEDNGGRVWAVDPNSKKVVATIAIPGQPEVLEYDAGTNFIYLNIKDKNQLVKIDPNSNTVVETWSTLPAEKPHGLAIDGKRHRVYSAGGNGQLVALDLKSGKVIASAPIAPGVDQIALDESKNLVLSACKGFISVTKVTPKGLEADEASVPSPKGAHTIAVDGRRQTVWISFSDDVRSHFQKYKIMH